LLTTCIVSQHPHTYTTQQHFNRLKQQYLAIDVRSRELETIQDYAKVDEFAALKGVLIETDEAGTR
jgi:hypothetical protein